MRLSIFDISGFLHGGNYGYSSFKVAGFPMGGVKYALRNIVIEGLVKDSVAICFDSSTNRKDLIPTYKTGRDKTNQHEIFAQADLLKDILDECGIATLKVDGYEADDLVYSLVEKYKGEFNFIRIFTNDADLAHNVTPRVWIEPSTSQGNMINFNNFSTSIVKGKDILVGTSTIYKVFCGDNSDRIPAFVSQAGVHGSVFYQNIVNFCKTKLPNNPFVATKREFLNTIINAFGSALSEKDKEVLQVRAEVFYPRKYDGELPITRFKQYKFTRLFDLLTICGEKQLLRNLGYTDKYEVSDSYVMDKIKSLSKLVDSGAYGGRKNLGFATSTEDYQSIELRSFV